jgi:hypothetical protein
MRGLQRRVRALEAEIKKEASGETKASEGEIEYKHSHVETSLPVSPSY